MATRQQLVVACRAVGVGVSGNKEDLLVRLLDNPTVAACIGRVAKRTKPRGKTTCDGKICKQVAAPPKKATTPLKGVKNGGTRLSASYYYHTICGGKISRCSPQYILQPNGMFALKRIQIVNGAHGREARWLPV